MIGADYVNKHKDTLVGAVDVYFGCRHKDHDWLYDKDMQQLKADGIITKLFTAFSRDENESNGSRRKYVQDVMLLDEESASRLQTLILEKDASVYVCGDGNAMAKDVQKALTEILSKRMHDEGGEEAAKLYIDKMKSENRYLQDIWTS
jgi:sulfite reductase alpha subunit-like flavoprotein